MHIPNSALLLILAFIPPAFSPVRAAPAAQAQAAPGQTQQAAAPSPSAAPAPVRPSAMLQPPLDQVRITLNSLRIEKWKKGDVREEAEEHVGAILRDLETNVPPLMTAADSAPGSLSKALPLVKHLDALYDVLLRVEEASRVVAPAEQITALQQALAGLEKARIALDDELTDAAAAQEKQVTDLQAALKSERAAAETKTTAAAAPTPCKPAPAVRKKKPAATKPAPSGAPGTKTP